MNGGNHAGIAHPEASGRRAGSVETISRKLEDMLLKGEIEPGDRLNELALSRHFGVSRTALREAVRGLEQQSLVEIVPNRGVVVRQVSIKDALDLYDLRAALFRMAARLAARRAATSDIEQLRELNRAMECAAKAERYSDYYARDLDFHALIVRACGNLPIQQSYSTAGKGLHLFRRRALQQPTQLHLSVREHDAILNALARHDMAACGDAAELHITLGRDRMLDTLNDRSARPER